MNDYQLVFIKWVDSYGCGSQWESIPDKEPAPHCCYSVGWIVKESDDSIVLVPHLSPGNEEIGADEQGCGDMTIPKVSIITRHQIYKGLF